MAQRFDTLQEQHIQFIQAQKIFFVGTATADSHINVSPKGMDAFRVLSPTRVAWLNVTGSGNETAAHVQHNPRMTIMFCAFDQAPLILRIYGTALAIHRDDAQWQDMAELFPNLPGARQIFDVQIELVQTSCGFGVPLFDYQGERETLLTWAEKKGDAGIRQYWSDKNQFSLDGIPSNIIK